MPLAQASPQFEPQFDQANIAFRTFNRFVGIVFVCGDPPYQRY